jgi:spermidine/putrescine transport system substrate-binding protein
MTTDQELNTVCQRRERYEAFMVDRFVKNKVVGAAEESGLTLSRRTFLKQATVASVVAGVGPWFIKDARSSSGELRLMNWSDELPPPVVSNFTSKTGIKVSTTPFSRVDEVLNKLQATDGEGFDVLLGALPRAPQFKEQGLLAPWKTAEFALSELVPSVLKSAQDRWSWDGGLYYIPHLWGSEGLAWRTDKTTVAPSEASWGLLWHDEFRGKVIARPQSLLFTIGLWLDSTGQVPSNRLLDTYKDEASFKKAFDPILAFAVQHKPWIKQFWTGADNTRLGLTDNGSVIGETWDGPAVALRKAGKPVSFALPKEGALGWLDGWILPKKSRNVAQAYEWVKYLLTPEVSAQLAEGSGYNPVVGKAVGLLSAENKAIYQEIYGGDLSRRLWTWPAQPPRHAALVAQYSEKLRVA